MSKIDVVGERVLAAYANAPRRERLHVSGRLRSCPVAAVASATPASGRILDFGCGHGVVALYLAMTGPERRVTGVDVDDDKIIDARAAAKTAEVDVEFEAVEPGYRPTGAWDAIVVVDVLYLLGEAAALQVVDAAAAALVAGGVLVVKEIDVRPRWKYWLATAQEFLSTKVLRITEGSQVEFVAPGVIDARMRAVGLEVSHQPCHRGRLHPHHLIIGRKVPR